MVADPLRAEQTATVTCNPLTVIWALTLMECLRKSAMLSTVDSLYGSKRKKEKVFSNAVGVHSVRKPVDDGIKVLLLFFHLSSQTIA